MNERDFCYWLQGMFELTDTNELSAQQVQQIKDHLKLVFDKKTPDYSITDWILNNNQGNCCFHSMEDLAFKSAC